MPAHHVRDSTKEPEFGTPGNLTFFALWILILSAHTATEYWEAARKAEKDKGEEQEPETKENALT